MKKRLLALCLVAVLAVSVVMPVRAAAPRTAAINVAYGITLLFNEQGTNMTDVNGKKVEPFVYNGTTYVPIRAVSELFGADIQYDAETNTAYVYDDFAEICFVAYRMSDIMETANDLANFENSCAIFGILGLDSMPMIDYSYSFNQIYNAYGRVIEVLNSLSKSKDNINISLIEDEIMPDYISFGISFYSLNSAYNAYRNNTSSANHEKFTDAYYVFRDKYEIVKADIGRFFQKYCYWRDLDLFIDN